MVSTRQGDYSTPEKNPPPPLECSPALRRPGDEDDKAKEGKAISGAVSNYATSLTFDDEQHANENNVAAGGDNNAGGKNSEMNDDDGGNSRGRIYDREGEQQFKEDMGEAWKRVTKKRKSQMSSDELRAYFDSD
jgi:hypothetical protein